MKTTPTIAASLLPGAALAHPGHLAEAAGHNHWIGLAALGAAVAVAGWAILKGRKDKEAETSEHDADPSEDDAQQEA
ncbi:DUF6732 family protein [Psychromarinibacter sp. S121]|uniref:DUF6732 family protein n=1 Tax=Psychromarinibacter sp. S121 TaxID=3415127 RepID=UPI003C7B7F76